MTRYTLLLTLFIACFGSAFGQTFTWEHIHESPFVSDTVLTRTRHFQVLPDGGAIGFMQMSGPNSNDLEILRLDGGGNLVWAFNLPYPIVYEKPTSTLFEGDKVMFLEESGEYMVVSTSGSLLRWDSLPKVDEVAYRGLTYQPNHGLIALGNKSINFIESPHMYRLDTNFNTLLDTTYNLSAIPFVAQNFKELSDGNLFLGGRHGYGTVGSVTRLVKLAPDGTLIWARNYSYLAEPSQVSVLEPSAGNLYMVVNTGAGVPPSVGNLLRIDMNGDTLWRKIPSFFESYFSMTEVNSRLIAAVMITSNFPSSSRSLAVLDTSGNKVSVNPLNVLGFPFPYLSKTQKGIMASWSKSNGHISQLDSLGNFAGNVVQGTVYGDTTLDCLQSAGEKGFPNMLVLVEPDSVFTFTDDQGMYELRTDSGNIWISMPQLPPLWSLNCPSNPDSHAVYFPSYYDTTSGLDFALEPDLLCPLVTASIATPFLRPCSVSTYTLEARNLGTLPASNAYVDVIFDSLVTVTGMSCPFTNIGPDSFRVQLGTLPVLGTATCTIDVLVSCDPSAVTGRTSCAKARAYPDLFCELPSALWDSSSVRVTGACQNGDSVAFVVENVGAMDMQAATSIVIAEDDLLRTTTTVQLNAGQDTVIKRAANGATWTLIADQVPYHPGNSFPRATVEACGVDSMGQFSIGHVTSLMYDDQDPWVDIHCQEITNSFDPNDKRGWPKGTGPLNYILDTDPIEYMIRFQNTGTDTAFTVVIRDALPPELDLSSFHLGLSSHPYTFQLLADNRLEWTFANIRLPDSATNEPASHGYVTFHIQQVPGNAPGTAIKNAANIYFDFNEAIVTDTSLHTVLDSIEGVLSLSLEDPVSLTPGIVAYPNPFGGSVTVRLDRPVVGGLSLELFDFQGRLLRRIQGNDNQSVTLDRRGLPAGMYVYRLKNQERQLHCGKLIAR